MYGLHVVSGNYRNGSMSENVLVVIWKVLFVNFLKKAMKKLKKAEKKGHIIEPADELEQYVPRKKWPRLRPSKFSRKVDMIDYYKKRIPELNEEIEELQNGYKLSNPMNSVAVEFVNLSYAQVAFQQEPYDQPQYFTPRQFGVEPSDIFWPNMQIFWWERISRRAVGVSIITVLVIFWAIPSALVGMISNLTYLTNKLTFLRFIYKLPSSLLGLVTSLLPTVMMTLLMMILPMFIRFVAKLSGAISIQQIEYYTQQSYFAFQVIQVFFSDYSCLINNIGHHTNHGPSILCHVTSLQ
ncbi:rsn1-like protein [Brettanomyces bruxellensis AWRI1499]|nr:rsn1-like protein [Brettanomyces bruxellensis AWRI1499]